MTSPYLEILVRREVAYQAIVALRKRLYESGPRGSDLAQALTRYEEEAGRDLALAIDGAIKAAEESPKHPPHFQSAAIGCGCCGECAGGNPGQCERKYQGA